MKEVKPEVFMVAETQTNSKDISAMLEALNVKEPLQAQYPSSPSGSEQLIEIGGRLCYKSFEVGLNPNVTKIREGNKEYIGNILKHHHGSVLEHGSVTFVLINVTRVLTHELVRHRAGCAYSQESLRFVRLTEISYYYPDIFDQIGSKDGMQGDDSAEVRRLFEEVIRTCEEFQKFAAQILDVPNLPFEQKKKVTSAMRRAAPIGLATNIMVTANHRAWRHIIEMRTSKHAEEEVILVVSEIARQLQEGFPNIYQDMSLDDDGQYVFGHSKV